MFLKLGLISRILCIRNSTTNSGNFGYNIKDKKAYIIFFLAEKKGLIKEFYSGNIRYSYRGLMQEVVNVTEKEKNMVIKEVALNLDKCITDAKSFIIDLMDNNTTVTINSKGVLEKYTSEILQTVRIINQI